MVFFSHFTCYLFHKIKTPRKSLIETKKSYESQDNSSIEPEGITSETLMMSILDLFLHVFLWP